jgi:hypothetical protein
MLDDRANELAGLSVTNNFWDAKIPLNLDDSDLVPEMKEAPLEHKGATEMIFVLLTCELGARLGNRAPISDFDGAWNGVLPGTISSTEKLQSIMKLEEKLQTKLIRYCDRSIPLHLLVLSVYEAMVYKMRVMAILPSIDCGDEDEIPQLQKDELFSECIRMTELLREISSNEGMKCFAWRINNYFQWHLLIYLVKELMHRFTSEEVHKAWRNIEYLYDYESSFLYHTNRTLPVAVGNLVLKAWQRYENTSQHIILQNAPEFVSILRRQRSGRQRGSEQGLNNLSLPTQNLQRAQHVAQSPTAEAVLPNIPIHANGGGSNGQPETHNLTDHPDFWITNENLLSLDPTPLNWSEWNGLIQDFNFETTGYPDFQFDMEP